VTEPVPKPEVEQTDVGDPRRNLFWLFISSMGISVPNQQQERRAMMLLIGGVVLLLLFVAAGMLTLFKLW
jgi:hypothetical protein